VYRPDDVNSFSMAIFLFLLHLRATSAAVLSLCKSRTGFFLTYITTFSVNYIIERRMIRRFLNDELETKKIEKSQRA
jgi:hypothetical protein